MKTTPRPFLPSVPAGIKDPLVARYLLDLQRAMLQVLADMNTDFSQGASTLTTFASAPTATNVAANQLVLRTDAGNEKIYVNIGGTMKSAALT